MKLPDELQAAIDRLVSGASPHSLRKARELLSHAYREGRTSHSIFSEEATRLSYLAARFPATYGACHRVFLEIQKILPSYSIKKMVDLGAGPGTATWAALDLFSTIEESILVEKNRSAIQLGQELQRQCPSSSAQMVWTQGDLESLPSLPGGDIALLSYALNELDRPEKLLSHIWNNAYPLIAIIEPGTPTGFNLIRRLRSQLIGLGAHILAPCPHALPCPMAGTDWCHFSARIERTKLHRLLKEGTLGYEDEKFSYVVASRFPPLSTAHSRILRHPQKGSGHVRLSLCTPQGNAQEKIISRKDKELYKTARDSEWGDSF